MSFRATLILAGIALALGLYVYLVEIRGAGRREEAEEAAKRLVNVEADAITRLELSTSDGPAARLVRDADGESWRLEAPLEFPADAGQVSHLLDALGRLKSESTLDAPPEDLALFGLGAESKRVRVWVDEELAAEIRFGGNTPVGSARYATLGDPPERLFTVPTAQASALGPRLFDLRDKRMVKVDPEDVQRLTLSEYRTRVATVERSEDGWKIVAPAEELGDSERIERLIQDLVIARATESVDEPGPPAEYGLDNPEVEVELETAQGSHRVMIGRVQDRAYVRVNDEAIVYRTADRLVMGMPRTLFAFRYKRVFDAEVGEVKRIEIAFPRDATTHVLLKEDGDWRHENVEVELNSFSVEDVLWALENLDAVAIVEQSNPALGLDPARVRVRLLDEEGAELGWLELGDPAPGEGIPARSSRRDTLWRVDTEIGDDVPLSEEAFQRNFVKSPPPTDDDAEQEAAPAESSPES